MNHTKTDRILEIVADQELPVVWFAEGGGGRPGDTDGGGASGLATPSFKAFAQLAGVVPKIAVVSGRCFAGNASFAGRQRDPDLHQGLQSRHGGPGDDRGRRPGRLRAGGHRADGRPDGQRRRGRAGARTRPTPRGSPSRRWAIFRELQVAEWTAADQRLLRRAIPENRLRVYDVRTVIETLVDAGLFPGDAPRASRRA